MNVDIADFREIEAELSKISSFLCDFENGIKLIHEKNPDYAYLQHIPESYKDIDQTLYKVHCHLVTLKLFIENFIYENTTPIAIELRELVKQLTPQNPLIIMKLTQLIDYLEHGQREFDRKL